MLKKHKYTFIALSVSLLTILVAIAITNILYKPKPMHKRGYQIEIAADGKPVIKKEIIVDIVALMKNADVENGAKIFKKCATCHNNAVGAGSKVGPNLYAVVGRKKAMSPGFSYSQALMQKGGSWNYEDLNLFLLKPKNYAPGTKMGFAGLKKPQDRADVIKYLESKK